MTKRTDFTLLIVICGALFFAACSSTKSVPEGDFLYTGGKVKIEDKKIKKKESKLLEGELTGLLRPKPNSSILGLRPKLWIYNLGANKKKGLGHWLSKKFGEPPVLFSTVKVDYNNSLITNRLENRGYFRSSSTADTSIKNKKASLTYHAIAGPQYKINSVAFVTDSTDLGKAVSATAPESFLKKGDGYDLDVIKAERERIDRRLKEQGFYFFGPDDILLQVDSTNNSQMVDLFVNVKSTTSGKSRNVYNINNITIYPDYSLKDTAINIRNQATRYDDFYIIDPKKTFRPRVFGRTMFFHKGDVYNRADHNLSLNRLVNLGTFRFVKNRFEETTDSAGKPALDAYYYLTPYQKKSIRLELLGKTNSANFTGPELDLTWRNRNAFKGAELLTFRGYVSTQTQFSSANQKSNVLSFGGESSLSIPHFIVPFKINSTSAFVPRTTINLGYDYYRRQNNYTLNSFRTAFGYNWKEDTHKEHQFNVLNVTYVQPSNVTEAYRSEIQNNPTLQHAIEKQFIFGPNYIFTYTNTEDLAKRNTFYYRGSVDVSGNVLGIAAGANFVKIENDIRHYMKLGTNSQWANRLIIGYGYSYGASTILPYVKQFFIGGTNSIRAFQARTLGPGTFRDPNINSTNTAAIVADQSGDIKLEINTEYRPKLFSIVRGALFIDAGNIWLQKEDAERPGAKFSKDFMKQIAVGTGAGLRFDLSFLVLRTDLAFPIRKPWLPEGQRWVIDDVNFGNKAWRKDNLVFNLAIGYPF